MDRNAIQASLSEAGALIDAGRSAEALARLRRFQADILDDELKVELLCLRSLATADMDQTDDALAQIREVVEEFPDSPRALGTLGLVLSRLSHWEDAAEALEQAVQLAPDDPTHLANLGLVLERMGEFASAREAYERSIAAGAEPVWVMPRLAVAQAELGERATAKQTLRKHLEIAPTDIDQWITLAIMFSDDEEYEDARQCYVRVEQIAPDNPMLRMNWGVTAVRCGKLTEACEQLGVLEKLEPMTSRPILLRAFLREAEGDDREALRTYDEALRVAETGDSHEMAYAVEMAMDFASRHGMVQRCDQLFEIAYRHNVCTADLCDAYREATGQRLKKAAWFSIMVEADYRPGLDEVTEPGEPDDQRPERFQRNYQFIARDRDDALTTLRQTLEQLGEKHIRILEFAGEEAVEDVFTGVYEIEPQSLVFGRDDESR